ncbi:MAG: hypothetical protein K2X82_28720 [Gemmataceae bacterium]|nr:hypothetical protein [Gemmataceae bacterium]
MSRTVARRWAKRGVWAALAAVLAVGCNPLTTIGFLLHRNDPLPAPYPLRPKEGELADKEREVKVLVLCGHSPGVSFEFAGADRELAAMLAKRLPELAKESKDKVAVIPAADVNKFKAKNPTWQSMDAAKLGKYLGADFVMDVTVGNVNIYQPGSGKRVYEGRAEVEVDVYDVTAPPADGPKHKYTHPFVYPKTGMKAVDDVPLSRFKQEFLERLALELARKHIDYKAGVGIAAEQ